MKWAKVWQNRVYFVWPWTKTLPDGTKVVKDLPETYSGRNKPRPECIVQVPDEVQTGWIWDGKKYKPVVKGPPAKAKTIREIIRDELEKALNDKKGKKRVRKD